MTHQTFERVEQKYLLSVEQLHLLKKTIAPFMELDGYGKSTIGNIYYDTNDYRLIRRSLEKPKYKEKLRVRSYGAITKDSKVFVELKKKYDGIVYKRRLCILENEVSDILDKKSLSSKSQIEREIDYFMNYYTSLSPKMMIYYDREAYYNKSGDDLRITFDTDIKYRDYDLDLTSGDYGEPILQDQQVLMEIKTSGGLPLWFTNFLSEQKLYKISFSKYGKAYLKERGV